MNKKMLILVAVAVLSLGIFTASAQAGQPNIIFILTDDLSWNLIEYMPNVQAMQKEGTTFANYFVTDSLCCPSRSTIFTGKLPHNTGVFTNSFKDEGGGYAGFIAGGNQNYTFAVELQKAGYKTAMLGKYLNGYYPVIDNPNLRPGWSDWYVGGDDYAEHNYNLSQNGVVKHYDSSHHPPSLQDDYLTDVLSLLGFDFMKKSKPGPFFIEIATFAPHAPYTPADRHKQLFPNLKAPQSKAFTEANNDPLYQPSCQWLADPALTPLVQTPDIDNIDKAFRLRAQAVQAVDEMIGKIRSALVTWGIADNTYIIFSSDNGYHMGEYRLRPGKQTPFDTDIRVPLIIVGPNVAKGRVVTEKIAISPDLCPTFIALGGISVPTSTFPDGHSLVPFLQWGPVQSWRHSALIEHRNGAYDGFDNSLIKAENPPSYEALRTKDYLYVEYYLKDTDIDSGKYYDVAYYNLHNDAQGNGPLCNVSCQSCQDCQTYNNCKYCNTSPSCQYYQCDELTNSVKNLADDQLKKLHYALCAYRKCKGSTECFDNQPLQNTQCETFPPPPPPPKKCTPYMSKKECCIISGGYWTGKECM